MMNFWKKVSNNHSKILMGLKRRVYRDKTLKMNKIKKKGFRKKA